jgi:hypothetical protein
MWATDSVALAVCLCLAASLSGQSTASLRKQSCCGHVGRTTIGLPSPPRIVRIFPSIGLPATAFSMPGALRDGAGSAIWSGPADPNAKRAQRLLVAGRAALVGSQRAREGGRNAAPGPRQFGDRLLTHQDPSLRPRRELAPVVCF